MTMTPDRAEERAIKILDEWDGEWLIAHEGDPPARYSGYGQELIDAIASALRREREEERERIARYVETNHGGGCAGHENHEAAEMCNGCSPCDPKSFAESIRFLVADGGREDKLNP